MHVEYYLITDGKQFETNKADIVLSLTNKERLLLARALHRLQDDYGQDTETEETLNEEHGPISPQDWERLLAKLDR